MAGFQSKDLKDVSLAFASVTYCPFTFLLHCAGTHLCIVIFQGVLFFLCVDVCVHILYVCLSVFPSSTGERGGGEWADRGGV